MSNLTHEPTSQMSRVDILIVEDNDLVARELKIVLIEQGFNVIKTVDNGEAALSVVRESSPDVVIMDINIKGEIDGVETTERINDTNPTPVIYLTALSDKLTYNRAKRTYPEAFLSKPFNELDLSRAIDLALQNFSLRKKAEEDQTVSEDSGHYLINDNVFVRNDNRFEKVRIGDIHFIAAEGSYCKIKTGEREFILSLNLSSFSQKLPHPSLVRVHRSYIVNIDLIDSFEADTAYIGDHEIPISRRFKDDFLSRMKHI